ncbi:MAG TPA: shikimate kinase [Oscillospiraceae bacterium]|nr:shikimate kinase [Oscillospiraceae bacterium]HPS76379.1 shikimate kinase [Oscillospiraceae bacterium]
MELDELRKEIDETDAELVRLFVRRMALSGKVADYKRGRGLPVTDAAREEEKLKAVRALAGEEFGDYVAGLYREVLRLSRGFQTARNGVFGLLGGKLGHSYSPELHRLFGGYDYALFERAPEELEAFLREAPFDGINVTIPYKKAVIPYCGELSENAARIGSVNTVVKLPDGRLRGDNTDYCGFAYLVKSLGVDVRGKKCVVLGDGGVAATVRAVLSDGGAAEIVTVSRRGVDNYGNLPRHADADVLVNTTPVGMYPDNGAAAVDLATFNRLSAVLDVVYNPNRTKLILDAERLGIPCAGGLAMLAAQAKRACELFTGRDIDEGKTCAVTGAIAFKMKNVALIGLPGCGKTTTGQALAALTGREFRDMDTELVKAAGMPIPDFFAQRGEAAFRALETEVLREFSKRSGLVIATGGGVVTRAENRDLLRQNSTVVFLEREDVRALPKAGRPVSQVRPIEQLAAERLPLYRAWCDVTVRGVDPQTNAKNILEAVSA